MNSLASIHKCAGRLFMALAAITSLLLLGACGSSSSSSGNQVGFSNSSLNGTYVFSSTGTDSNGGFVALAGAITADGNGHITGGNVDVVDLSAGWGSGAATGGYTVGADGRGQFSVAVANVQTFKFNFVLSSTSHGLVTEFDTFGSGSGTMDLQTALTGISQLANPYALSLAGVNSSGSAPVASGGSITFNSSGVSTAGIQDFNENGLPLINRALSGTATLGTGTAPGTMVLDDALGNGSTFDFYPIDSTHFKVIETDLTNAFLAGDFYTQAGAAIPVGQVVFTMAGGTANLFPTVLGGYATTDANGNFTNGSADLNQQGTFVTSNPFSGSASSGGAVGGRVLVAVTGLPNAAEWVLYPTTSAGLIILQIDSDNVTLGAAYAQSATSFAATQNYGLNLTGYNISAGAEVDDTVQFLTASPSSSPNMTGLIDENAEGLQFTQGAKFSGTYTPDPSPTGRGNILAPSLNTVNGGLGLEYYVVDNTTTLFIEGGNGDTAQVGVGSFLQQTSPTSQVALKHPVVALFHSTSHAHGAAKPGQKWTPQNK
jgi:hypothetical protein